LEVDLKGDQNKAGKLLTFNLACVQCSAAWGDLVMAAVTGARPDLVSDVLLLLLFHTAVKMQATKFIFVDFCRKDRIVWIDIFAVRQWPGNSADLDFRGVIGGCTAVIVAMSTIAGLTECFLDENSRWEAFLARWSLNLLLLLHLYSY